MRLAVAKTDTILAHCIGRAVIADAGGLEAARATYGDQAEGLKSSKWQAFKAAAKATPASLPGDLGSRRAANARNRL